MTKNLSNMRVPASPPSSAIPSPKPEVDRDDTSATALLNVLVDNFVSNDLMKLDKLKEELLGMEKGVQVRI